MTESQRLNLVKQTTYRFAQLSESTQIQIVMKLGMTNSPHDAIGWAHSIRNGALSTSPSKPTNPFPCQLYLDEIVEVVDREYYKWRDSFMN